MNFWNGSISFSLSSSPSHPQSSLLLTSSSLIFLRFSLPSVTPPPPSLLLLLSPPFYLTPLFFFPLHFFKILPLPLIPFPPLPPSSYFSFSLIEPKPYICFSSSSRYSLKLLTTENKVLSLEKRKVE